MKGGLLNYNEGNGRRIRFLAKDEITSAPGTTFIEQYPYNLALGGNAALAIDHLFAPSTDFWDRSWIYCDHVVAAIHLESVQFGKRRRENSDVTFNAAVQTRGAQLDRCCRARRYPGSKSLA